MPRRERPPTEWISIDDLREVQDSYQEEADGMEAHTPEGPFEFLREQIVDDVNEDEAGRAEAADGGVMDWSSVMDASRTITDELFATGADAEVQDDPPTSPRDRHDSMMGAWIAQMVSAGMLNQQQAINFSRRLDDMPGMAEELTRHVTFEEQLEQECMMHAGSEHGNCRKGKLP